MVERNVGQKNVGPKIILDQKFKSKPLSSKQFWVKKVFKSEKFYVQIIFRPEKVGSKKILGLQILDRQKCSFQTNFCPKKFRSKKVWVKQNFGQK